MSSIAAFLLVASSVVGQAEGAEPNPLQEYADDFRGGWMTEIEAEEDSPDGSTKKGDPIRIEGSIEWALEKAILVIEAKIGPTDSSGDVNVKAIVAWDPKNNELFARWFWDTGAIGKTTYRKVGGEWKSSIEIIQRDGVKESWNETVQMSDDNDTHTHIQTKRKRGDQELPNRTVVYTRK
jgi:hypothetical protein